MGVHVRGKLLRYPHASGMGATGQRLWSGVDADLRHDGGCRVAGLARTWLARARPALLLYLVQLAVNALWSWLFFGWKLGALAFADILVLIVLVCATIVTFARTRPAAAVLLLPISPGSCSPGAQLRRLAGQSRLL